MMQDAITAVEPTNVPVVPVTIPQAVQPEQLHRVNLKDFLEREDGKFVGIDFVKQDGTERKLNGRLGVVKYLEGGDNTVEGQNRPYLTLFDMKAKGYRAVNLSTISKIRAEKRVFQVIG